MRILRIGLELTARHVPSLLPPERRLRHFFYYDIIQGKKQLPKIEGQGNPFRARPLKRGKNKLQMKIPP